MVAATIDKGGAPDRGVNVRPWLAAALPVAAALAYPWLLAGVSTVAQPSAPAPPPGPTAVIATAAAILLCAAVVCAAAEHTRRWSCVQKAAGGGG